MRIPIPISIPVAVAIAVPFPVPVARAGQLYFIQTAAVGIWHASSAAAATAGGTMGEWDREWERDWEWERGQMSCAKFKGVRPISWQQT